MYSNQQSQQQLPFNPDNLTNQYLNIDLNNPPFVPNIQTVPEMQKYLSWITGTLASKIQELASSNPLRMFMYNQCSANNYANNDFAGLVNATVDYVTMIMLSNSNNNASVENVISSIIPEMLEMVCAANVQAFPALEKYTNQEVLNRIRGTVNQFQQLMSQINSFKNQQQPRGNYQGNQNNRQGGRYQQGNYQQPRGNYQSASSDRFSNQQTNTQQGSSMFSNQSIRDNPATSHVGRSAPTERFSGQQHFEARKSMQQDTFTNNQSTAQTAFVEPTQQPKEEALTIDDWIPTENQMYLNAFDPSTHCATFVRNANGVVIQEINEFEGDPMDYDRHSSTTVFGPIPKSIDLSHISETVSDLVNSINALNGNDNIIEEEEIVPKKYIAFTRKETIHESCENDAWFTMALERYEFDIDKIPPIYRAFAVISDPTVSGNDETRIIIEFGKSNTFIELREKMNSCANMISSELWNKVNSKVTTSINRVLNQNLCIPKSFCMETFVEDIEPLFKAIDEFYGPVIHAAFVKHQREIIEGIFQVQPDEIAEQFTTMFLTDLEVIEGKEPKITYLSSCYSLTILKSLSCELSIDLSSTTSAIVVPNITPVMFDLLEQLFIDVSMRDEKFEHHYIQTIDGRILEASRGYVNEGCYLLTLVK